MDQREVLETEENVILNSFFSFLSWTIVFFIQKGEKKGFFFKGKHETWFIKSEVSQQEARYRKTQQLLCLPESMNKQISLDQ